LCSSSEIRLSIFARVVSSSTLDLVGLLFFSGVIALLLSISVLAEQYSREYLAYPMNSLQV